ncbi:MAG TPA: hypothetical protein PLP27_06645 [Crocinitomicaceae bacterium]|nr:hypothetical protein [Crocinitomicaceae bacterium]
MRKISLILGVVALSFTTVSCKKDYNCNCTWEEEHGDHHHDENETFALGKVSKKDANAKCDDKKTTLSADDHNEHVDCKAVIK